MILDEIIRIKKEELKELKAHFKMPEKLDQMNLPPIRDFKSGILASTVNIIAEVKSASPSSGIIINDYDPANIAKKYEKNGAAAISVLTDKQYFKGDIGHIKLVKAVTTIPVLRKDFIIDEAQVFESRLAGADAILLIVRILKPEKLGRLMTIANDLGMACLVEVHSVAEARIAMDASADIIGINNRNLDSLKVDISTTLDIIKGLPKIKEKVIVSESGIKGREDIDLLSKAGANAFLIGEALLKSKDVGQKLQELVR
jgi:indole-3-glycerol phosphate synthase